MRWWKVALLVPLATVAGCGEGQLLGPERSIAVDEVAMQQVEERLRPALTDFDALETPAGAISAGTADLEDCFRDSGQVHQPAVIREWSLIEQARADDILDTTPLSREAGQTLAADLEAAGWIISRELTPAGQIFLSRKVNGYELEGSVTVFNDAIFVSAAVERPAPCSD